jgi:hypothetical protein
MIDVVTTNNRSFADRAVAALIVFIVHLLYSAGPLALRGTTYSEDDELEVRCFGFHVSTGILGVRRTPHGSWPIRTREMHRVKGGDYTVDNTNAISEALDVQVAKGACMLLTRNLM